MPTYEYACRACGHRFDIVQKMSDDPLVICPECGGELRKVFAPPAISFKGSGFYATDHGKKAKASGGAAGEKSSEPTSPQKESEKKAGTKSDPGGEAASRKEPATSPSKKEGSAP